VKNSADYTPKPPLAQYLKNQRWCAEVNAPDQVHLLPHTTPSVFFNELSGLTLRINSALVYNHTP
jgi:hypothetical protein